MQAKLIAPVRTFNNQFVVNKLRSVFAFKGGSGAGLYNFVIDNNTKKIQLINYKCQLGIM